MKTLPNTPHRLLPLIAAFFAIAHPPAAAHAQCPETGTITFNGVAEIPGKPLEAKHTQTVVNYGSNGAKRVQVTKANLFRDSNGRVRVERFYDGTDDPPELVPTDITIMDNCGNNIYLLPGRKIATITKTNFRVPGADRPYCEEIDPKNPPHPAPNDTFEDLGHKILEGIEIRGWRQASYMSAAGKLAGKSPVSVVERWCSRDLQMDAGAFSSSESPRRTVTIVVSEIKQVEPDPTLFEIPEGFAIAQTDQSAQKTGGQNNAPA